MFKRLAQIFSLFAFSLFFSSAVVAQEKVNVTFINPGKSTEAFWMTVSAFMKAAADDLSMNLEVIYLERDHTKQVPTAMELSKRSKKPDYVVLVNEKLVAPDTIKALDAAGIKSFLILNDLTDAQKAELGRPRAKYKSWLGTMTPDNTDAGNKIAAALFAEARKRGLSAPEVLAISGNRATPASIERKEGLDKAIKASGDLRPKLVQEVWAEFEEGRAYEMSKGLFARYPNVKIVWAANDPMAIGAMRAAKELGKSPGKDILFGGLNWSNPALAALKADELTVTVGGHFMTGGWAMVAIYDHANGADFAQSNGLEISPEVFGALTSANVESYSNIFGGSDWGRIDFTSFSRSKNPRIQKYDFSLTRLLRSVK